MEYFGYMRRNPDDAPDGNFLGYTTGCASSQFDGNYFNAAMVQAFLVPSSTDIALRAVRGKRFWVLGVGAGF